MKILFFANTDWYLYNFRGSLISAVVKRGHEVVLVSPKGPYVPKLKQMPVRWVRIDMDRGSLNPYKEAKVLSRLAKIYKNESPDVVHHFTLKCVLYGMITGLSVKNIRSINAVTGLGYVYTAKKLKAKLLKPILTVALRWLLYRGNSAVIVQNNDDYQMMLEQNLVKAENLALIQGSGVNIERFSPVPKESEDYVTVAMGTRLLIDKGIREYVAAASKILKKRNDVTFLLAGDTDLGNPSAITQEEIDTWKQQGNIQLLGHVDDMRELLAKTDIAVLPSYREGLPRILIEAAACGLPIVTTDAPGCREVIEDNVSGFLVPVGDVHNLAVAIEKLVDSPTLRRKMGKAGRQLAEKRFDERIVIDATIKMYQE